MKFFLQNLCLIMYLTNMKTIIEIEGTPKILNLKTKTDNRNKVKLIIKYLNRSKIYHFFQILSIIGDACQQGLNNNLSMF